MSRLISVVILTAILCGTIPSKVCQSENTFQGQRESYHNDYIHENAVRRTVYDSTSYNLSQETQALPMQEFVLLHVPGMGSVRGNNNYKLVGHRFISSFLGLRYAELENSGLARFQEAKKPDYSRSPVFDATKKSRNCPQFPELQNVMEAEARQENINDCLTLDVYTANVSSSVPVILFVHGEMLFDGSSEEGQPDYLLDGNLVLVSLNYRLAPFGFLSTLTDEMPGNVALADIKQALEWLQSYVQYFGGDPQRVTIMGQAGGATLVHALSLSGKAQGLYEKLILQSGTALNPYLIDEDPLRTVRHFARLARCPLVTGDRQRESLLLNRCFERLSTSELLSIFQRHWKENESRGLGFTGGFKLVIGDRLGYLTKHPSALVANNTYPMIAGTTKDAGAFILSRFFDQLGALRSGKITDYIDIVLKHTAQPRHHHIWRNWALQQIFIESEIRSPTIKNVSQGLLELINLILYRAPLIDSIRYTSSKYPTYLYVFDYRGQFHRFGEQRNPLPFEADATLSDDNIYLFPYPKEVSELNVADKRMSQLISSLWVNFVENGVPNLSPNEWPHVSTEYGPFIRFTAAETNPIELDQHFGDGIPVPNLYPQYFTTTISPRFHHAQYPSYGIQNQ